VRERWVKQFGKNKIEFVIIATYNYTPDALSIYKDRWQIETMVKALKSSGFNFEVTHLTDNQNSSHLCVSHLYGLTVPEYTGTRTLRQLK